MINFAPTSLQFLDKYWAQKFIGVFSQSFRFKYNTKMVENCQFGEFSIFNHVTQKSISKSYIGVLASTPLSEAFFFFFGNREGKNKHLIISNSYCRKKQVLKSLSINLLKICILNVWNQHPIQLVLKSIHF